MNFIIRLLFLFFPLYLTNFTLLKATSKQPEITIKNLPSKISKTNKVEDIEKVIYQLIDFYGLSEVLIFFDCDDVLFQFRDCNLKKPNIKDFIEKFKKYCNKTGKVDSFEKGCQLLRTLPPRELVDPLMPKIVSSIIKKGGTVFCLTQCASIPEIRSLRVEMLKSFGYSFCQLGDSVNEMQLKVSESELAPKFLQQTITFPVFQDGVVFAGSASKGDAMTSFIELFYKINPLKKEGGILLIDDSMDNLMEVEKACRKVGKNCYLILYTATDGKSNLDDDLAEYQMSQLCEGKWPLNGADTDSPVF
ncbi:MAG: DUF2608 domain-containing protein [Holosporales bacterium]|jgi:hypothetical protein|nr:DUF2608 domain-containing protein [Holosporales bacterium]